MKIGKRLSKVVTSDHDDLSNDSLRDSVSNDSRLASKKMKKRRLRAVKLGKRLSKVVTSDHDDLSIDSLRDSVSNNARLASKKMKKCRLRAVKVSLDNDPQSDCEKTTVNNEELAVSFYQLFINKVIINHC